MSQAATHDGVMLRDVELDDAYTREDGYVFLTGMQALVRAMLDSARLDREVGRRIGTLVNGYPGSPLGGLDAVLGRAGRHLDAYDIHHRPGLNEELAAAAVMGSQMTDLFPAGGFDGVTGVWYGKAPGVDRSGDVFRHANFGGNPPACGAIALTGDDPSAKSSTLPTQSEYALVNAGMPVLYPSTVAEFRTFAIHAIRLSRYAGVWSGLKVVTDLCDGGQTVDLGSSIVSPVSPEFEVDGRAFEKANSFSFVPPTPLELERTLFTERLPAAQAYVRANGLDVLVGGEDARLGIVAAGKSWTDLQQALDDLGVDERILRDLGIRLLKPALIYPLDAATVREFAAGLDRLVVVEEKRPFIEDQIKQHLYGTTDAPRILGKQDAVGQPMFPVHGELDADAVSRQLGPLLLNHVDREEVAEAIADRLRSLQTVRSTPVQVSLPMRAPNYCSGCPHNRSTVAVKGMSAGGGIGCHGMGSIMTQPERQILYMVPMGTEGAPWLGAAPFTSREHFIQNVGDGTFFHSGSQAVRAAVDAGVNLTFRLLWNDAVAMTGGQEVTGARSVPQVTHALQAEGVRRIIVVAEEPARYRSLSTVASNAVVWDRERYDEALRELAATDGVTVLIFDQRCAAEKRRARKRGRLPLPTKHVLINTDVCEGCGDCGAKSNCPSVMPIETEFGRKTQIEQSSCNADYSCLDGDCPSFLTIYTAAETQPRPATTALPLGVDTCPEPTLPSLARPYRIYLPGIGGTGITTLNQVLAYAALIDGLDALTLDQTGLAQKGGAVLSNLVVGRRGALHGSSNRGGAGATDLLLAADPLSAASNANLVRYSVDRTTVVGNVAVVPTGEAIRHVDRTDPPIDVVRGVLDGQTRAERNIWLDASSIADQYFADHLASTLILLGAAYQRGLVPMRAAAIEAAIGLNGVAVEQNVAAFRLGRLAVHDPSSLEAEGSDADHVAAAQRSELSQSQRRAYEPLVHRCRDLEPEARGLLERRIAELIDYQNADYAETYVDRVLSVAERERDATPGRHELTRAVIRSLFKLMAYKDEYEVARLLLKQEWDARVRDRFGPEAKVKYNLHPPVLRNLGYGRKLELGAWVRPALRLLVSLRRVRGTRWDPFGRSEVRRTERELIDWYARQIDEVSRQLTTSNHHLAVEIAQVADLIRGYEHIKLDGVEAAHRRVDELRAQLRSLPVVA